MSLQKNGKKERSLLSRGSTFFLFRSSWSSLSATGTLHTAYQRVRTCQELQTLEFQVTYLIGFTDSERSNVDNELLWNLLNRSLHFQVAHACEQHTTGSYTFCMTLKSYRDIHVDFLFRINLIEVNVKHIVLNRMELDFPHYCHAFVAVEVKVYLEYLRRINQLAHSLKRNLEICCDYITLCIFLCTIDDTRNDVLFSLGFGPVLIDDGIDVTPENYPWGEVNDTYARSALGWMERHHYLTMNINCGQVGTEYYNLATLRQAADAMIAKGCRKAYALDGGQTATTVFGGMLINPVQFGQEKEISDIIYFASALGAESIPQETVVEETVPTESMQAEANDSENNLPEAGQ